MNVLDEAGLAAEAGDSEDALDDDVRGRSHTADHTRHEGAVAGVRIGEAVHSAVHRVDFKLVRVLNVGRCVRLHSVDPGCPGACPGQQAGVHDRDPDGARGGWVADAGPRGFPDGRGVLRHLGGDNLLGLGCRAAEVTSDDERVIERGYAHAEAPIEVIHYVRRVVRLADVYVEPGDTAAQRTVFRLGCAFCRSCVRALVPQGTPGTQGVLHTREVPVAGQQGAAVVEVVDPLVVLPGQRPGAHVGSVLQCRSYLGHQPLQGFFASFLIRSSPGAVTGLGHALSPLKAAVPCAPFCSSLYLGRSKISTLMALLSLPLGECSLGKQCTTRPPPNWPLSRARSRICRCSRLLAPGIPRALPNACFRKPATRTRARMRDKHSASRPARWVTLPGPSAIFAPHWPRLPPSAASERPTSRRVSVLPWPARAAPAGPSLTRTRRSAGHGA